MFKLQRLEITGFKSFADHTDLRFTGDGITAIVGPNGCGKSNVADAIAWVLGEQRVKHLRGGEMKDVIFQGSRNRAPSGMSEVVLHMVRDETVEDEPDIQDIDSTLEQIDSHEEIFEAPELALSEPGAVATGSETQVEHASNNRAAAESVPGAAATGSVESATDPVATAAGTDSIIAGADDNAQGAAPEKKPKQHHHRHWRQRRNLALEFAPGEAISVTRRLYRARPHRPDSFRQANGPPHDHRRGGRYYKVSGATTRRRSASGIRARESQSRRRHYFGNRTTGEQPAPSGRESSSL